MPRDTQVPASSLLASLKRLSRSMAPLSRGVRLTSRLVTLLLQVLQPPRHRNDTGLGCSGFARHYYRNRVCFIFLQVLRWFTSLGLLVPAYVFSGSLHGFTMQGFPIRKSPGQSLFAAHRGLSQLTTSFIAIFRQGIHRAPLVT